MIKDDDFWELFFEVISEGDFDKGVVADCFVVEDVYALSNLHDSQFAPSSRAEALACLRKFYTRNRLFGEPFNGESIDRVIEDFISCKSDEQDDFDAARWADA